jgi:hypothetical protein
MPQAPAQQQQQQQQQQSNNNLRNRANTPHGPAIRLAMYPACKRWNLKSRPLVLARWVVR